MPLPSLLDNITIILVRTKTPGNIGAVARCMMNMGISRLRLVRPRNDTLVNELKRARGADDVIRKAEVYASLNDAIADHGLVIGTSRRITKERRNIQTPRDMANRIIPLLSENRIALVFGREVNGLSREDIALCHELIAIPSSDAFPSINLSHAVMVVVYELFLAAGAALPASEIKLAPANELEQFYSHLREILAHIGFIDTERSEHIMFSLRQMFGRARLDEREVSILRGILTEIKRTGKTEQS